MNADRVTYLDSSALVKLAVHEPESLALRAFLRRRRPLVSSALARVEVGRALIHAGPRAVRRGTEVLRRIELIRVNDRLLDDAAALGPPTLRSLDALHLATAQRLEQSLRRLVTYDERMADAATTLGISVASPA